MTGRKNSAPGYRPVLRAVAEALPGQTLTVFMALIATGAIAIGAIAFDALPGSRQPAVAAGLGVNDPALRMNHGNPAAVPAAESDASASASADADANSDAAASAPAETETDAAEGDSAAITTDDSPDESVISSASPEPSPPSPDLTTSRSIPLTEADKQLLIKVRQAGLWEIPTGQQAQQRAESPIVKAVGRQLAADHLKLDKSVLALAAQLDVVLPSTPSELQTGWMNELSKLSGADYDRRFADRLRAAHGGVFTIIAQVRTGTRNPLIREYAQIANVVVMRHMTLLESTGLVSFEDLPAPVLSQASSSDSGGGSEGVRTVLIVVMLGAAALIGTISIRRVRRGE